MTTNYVSDPRRMVISIVSTVIKMEDTTMVVHLEHTPEMMGKNHD